MSENTKNSNDRRSYTTQQGDRVFTTRRAGESDAALDERVRWGRFDELAIDWVVYLRGNTPDSTLSTYRSDLNSMILPNVGHLWLVECDRNAFELLVAEAVPRGVTRADSMNRTLGSLIAWALVEDRWPAETLPFGGHDYRKAKVRRTNKLTVGYQGRKERLRVAQCPTWDQAAELGEVVEKIAVNTLGAEFAYLGQLPCIQYATGTRIAEVVVLHDDHLDREMGFLHVASQFQRSGNKPSCGTPENPVPLIPPKGGHTRNARIWDWAMDELLIPLAEDARASRNGWLLGPYAYRRAWVTTVEDIVREARQTIGYPFRPHFHRHAYATVNLAPVDDGGHGATLHQVADWLGDDLDTVIQTYWHPSTEGMTDTAALRAARRR